MEASHASRSTSTDELPSSADENPHLLSDESKEKLERLDLLATPLADILRKVTAEENRKAAELKRMKEAEEEVSRELESSPKVKRKKMRKGKMSKLPTKESTAVIPTLSEVFKVTSDSQQAICIDEKTLFARKSIYSSWTTKPGSMLLNLALSIISSTKINLY